jgi:hypothetical protein
MQDTDVRALMDVGRRAGRVSTDDFRRLLPIDSMSPEDIANVVLRLEERGIAVDLDPNLFVPGSKPSRPSGDMPDSVATLRPEPPSRRAPGPQGAVDAPVASPGPPLSARLKIAPQSRTLWVIVSTVIAVAIIILLSFAL